MIPVIPSKWSALGGILFGLTVSWWIQGLRWDAERNALESQHKLDIGTARSDEQGKCKQRQQVTKGSSNVYWKHIDDLNREHRAELNRVRANAAQQCVRVPGAAGGDHATSGGADFSTATQIAPESLIDFARDADEQRATLIGCQEYIRGATAQ